MRDAIAKNQTTESFTTSIEKAIAAKMDFCYETNFDTHPIHWPQIFQENGYRLNLIFFCLEDINIAKHRIQVRTEFKGHFVTDFTVNYKWKAGYKNLNRHFKSFNNILIVDNSFQNEVYTNIVQIEDDVIELMSDKIPRYFEHRLPEIYKIITIAPNGNG